MFFGGGGFGGAVGAGSRAHDPMAHLSLANQGTAFVVVEAGVLDACVAHDGEALHAGGCRHWEYLGTCMLTGSTLLGKLKQ